MGRMLTLVEAAQLASMSYQATHKAVLQGRLLGRKVGKHWLVERSSVLRLLQARQREARALMAAGALQVGGAAGT
jgi:hypothetical protein